MKVALLFGGDVAAFDESRKLADVMGAALSEKGHEACLIDMTPVCDVVMELERIRPDICLIVPGSQGADGPLQSLLEFMQMPFVGSNAHAVALSQDDRLVAYEYARFAEASGEEDLLHPLVSFTMAGQLVKASTDSLVRLCKDFLPGGFPCEVVSGDRESTVVDEGDETEEDMFEAVQIVNNASELRRVLELATSESASDPIVIRQWVEGLRVSVFVLGTGWDAHVLVPIDAATNKPVELSALATDEATAQAIRSELERCAFEVCLALGAQDFAQVELIWDGAQVRFVSVDLLPSLAASTPFEAAGAQAGLTLAGVLDHLVSL